MAKHTREELKQMQSLPLEIKIRMTERRIREWYEHYQGQVYVSFSGGKDSTVLADIVHNRCGLGEYSKRRPKESERLSQKIEHNARNVKYSQPNNYP